MHNIIKQKSERGANHNLKQELQHEFSQFFVINLQHDILETLVDVDTSPSEKHVGKKLAGMQTTPTLHCGGYVAAAQITPWSGKKSATPPNIVLLPHCIKLKESDIHIIYVPNFCHHRYCFYTACMPHAVSYTHLTLPTKLSV